MVSYINRFFQNYIAGLFVYDRYVTAQAITRIDSELNLAESKVAAEIAFVIEPRMPVISFLAGHSPSDRAKDLFSKLRVWDTQNNNGILIYLLLAEKDIEILVDREIARIISSQQLQAVCAQIENAIRNAEKNNKLNPDKISTGVIAGINLLVRQLLDSGMLRQVEQLNEVAEIL